MGLAIFFKKYFRYNYQKYNPRKKWQVEFIKKKSFCSARDTVKRKDKLWIGRKYL